VATDLQERRTAFQILVAFEGLGLEKVLALSTYGAQPGQYLSDRQPFWRPLAY
jgi:hypothetical protein